MPLNNFVRLSCLGLTVYKLMRCLKAMPHDFLIALAFQRGVRLTFVCRLSALWLTDSFHAEAPLDGELKEGGGWGWWWGWGTLNKVLYGEFLPPVQPLTILYTISDRKGTPFPRGGYSLGGEVRPGSLTLFKTKIADFPTLFKTFNPKPYPV